MFKFDLLSELGCIEPMLTKTSKMTIDQLLKSHSCFISSLPGSCEQLHPGYLSLTGSILDYILISKTLICNFQALNYFSSKNTRRFLIWASCVISVGYGMQNIWEKNFKISADFLSKGSSKHFLFLNLYYKIMDSGW